MSARGILGRLAALEAGRPEQRDLAAEAALFGTPQDRNTYLQYEHQVPVLTLVVSPRLAYQVVGMDSL